MTTAVGYVRVSTKKDEQATSPAIQRAMIEQECERQGWDLLRMFEDRYSGENLDRPDFQDLKSYLIQNQVNLLIVKDLSRFGRETLDYLNFTRTFLEPRGIELYVLQGANGKERGIELVRLLDMWIAEDFRITNKRKVKAAVEMCASKGYWNGVIPYGYYSSKRDTGRGPCILKIDNDTAKIVRQIFDWAASGVRARTMVRRLNLQGIPSPKEAQWCTASVTRIIHNKVYLGRVNYRGESLPGAHEPLVSEELWEKAQGTLTRGRDISEPGRYLLSRVYCPTLQRTNGLPQPYYGMAIRGRRRYTLAQRDPARETAIVPTQSLAQYAKSLDADVVERIVLDCFKCEGLPEQLPSWWVEIQRKGEEKIRREEDDLAALNKELHSLGKQRTAEKKRLDKALDFGVEADIRERYEHIALIDRQIEEVKLEAAKLEGRIESQKEPLEMPLKMIQQINVIKLLRDNGDRAALRQALRVLVDRILVRKDDRGEISLEIVLRSNAETRRVRDSNPRHRHSPV